MTARELPSLIAPWLVLISCSVSAQQLTARDAFWSASDMISVTPNPAAQKQTAARARAQHPTAAPAPTQESEAAIDAQHTPGLVHAVQLVSEKGYGAAPHLVRTAGDRLGLRCSLLLRGLDGRYIEVAPGAAFHSGDHIRLGLLANSPGYIYVIQQGSSGAWSPIFPPPGSAHDVNKIGAGQMQLVPGGTHAFAFDQNPGDEKLYIILSRAPIADIDHAIQGLKGSNAPAPSHTGPPAETTLIAENKIPDFFVQQLASRDLTLVDEQKVDESSSGDGGAGEKAIYVVSKTGGADSSSQVVLSLDLHHE